MKTTRKEIVKMIMSSILCLLPILLAVLVYDDLPDQVPIHFNAQGVADGYASKSFASFGLPCILLLLNLIIHFILNSDPKKNNAKGVVKELGLWCIPVLSVIINIVIIFMALGHNIPIQKIVPALVGFLFVIIGIYLPSCKQNYTVGFKLPWTLNSEENWNKTHKVAGKSMIASGAIMLISILIEGSLIYFILVSILVVTLIPIIYSYVLYKKGI